MEQRHASSAPLARRRLSDVGRRHGPSPTVALWLVLVLGLGAMSTVLVAEPAHGSAVLAAGLTSDSPTPTPTRIPASTLAPTPVNVYQGTGVGMFSPTVAADPFRVYVPDEASGTVIVINPRTFRI